MVVPIDNKTPFASELFSFPDLEGQEILLLVVNATFYLELALGRSLAWVDPRLTARWEAVVYACSAGLALGWLALMHASLDTSVFLVIGAFLSYKAYMSS